MIVKVWRIVPDLSFFCKLCRTVGLVPVSAVNWPGVETEQLMFRRVIVLQADTDDSAFVLLLCTTEPELERNITYREPRWNLGSIRDGCGSIATA